MGSSSILCEDSQLGSAAQGYVLQNQVTHVRLLPAASKHSFVYSTVSMLLSLDALERHKLDLLRGWLFGYGGIWGRVAGLRSLGYLHDNPHDKRTIRQKLGDVLDARGWPGSELRDAWLMTMPSLLGYEGINPLNVYFCYRYASADLWLIVLEIHNTFGERNIDVLEVGKNEEMPPKFGFDHQWKFPRQFHVSPFNDRSGHYICQITSPFHPPFQSQEAHPLPPCPVVKITLLTAPPHEQAKIIAILRTTRCTPLSSMSLLSAIARAPFSLLLSFPRILYQAFLLHYHKRLDVYKRPEPRAPDPTLEAKLPAVFNAVQSSENSVGGGIGWQPENFLEAWCKRRVYTFLRDRCNRKGISVTFISSNPFQGRTIIGPIANVESGDVLSIYYRSPRLFTILFAMPSPAHALLYGSQAEKVFSVSSRELFLEIFAPQSCVPPGRSIAGSLAWRIRRAFVPATLNISLPSHHSLDDPITFMHVFVLSTLWLFATLEKAVFKIFGARFVPGDEPWNGWEKLNSSDPRTRAELGSMRRDHGS